MQLFTVGLMLMFLFASQIPQPDCGKSAPDSTKAAWPLEVAFRHYFFIDSLGYATPPRHGILFPSALIVTYKYRVKNEEHWIFVDVGVIHLT